MNSLYSNERVIVFGNHLDFNGQKYSNMSHSKIVFDLLSIFLCLYVDDDIQTDHKGITAQMEVLGTQNQLSLIFLFFCKAENIFSVARISSNIVGYERT